MIDDNNLPMDETTAETPAAEDESKDSAEVTVESVQGEVIESDETDAEQSEEEVAYYGRPNREKLRQMAREQKEREAAEAEAALTDEQRAERYEKAMHKRKVTIIELGLVVFFFLVFGIFRTVKWIALGAMGLSCVILTYMGISGLLHYFRHKSEYKTMRAILVPWLELIVMWTIVKLMLQYIRGEV